MLKTAQKLSSQKRAAQEVTKTAARSITTHYIYENHSMKNNARKEMLDTYAQIRHHVGYLRLNREHRHNTLTPNYIKNIRRSLNTLNEDEIVKVIYMTGGKGEHFSNGTDFRTLLHHKTAQAPAKIASYLEDLYGLQIQTAKLNKPLIGVAPGHSFNSGAAFFSATGYPTVTLDSKLSFNDVSFGFVPHSGSSFYLSRLPGELGTFLALTGFPMTGIDAKELGIADQLVHYSQAYEEEISDVLFAMELPVPDYELISNSGKYVPWKTQLDERLIMDAQKEQADIFEYKRKKLDNMIYEEFQEPKDKIPSMTAEADFRYKKMMEKYNQRFKENQEATFFEGYEGVNQNYYDYILGYVKSHSGHEYPHTSQIKKNLVAISRIFRHSTYEEIVENLRKEELEGSKFAAACLKKMDTNSELSMKLALRLVREAKNLDFKGALQNEINVALNKIQDKEFDLGISEVLLKPHAPAQPVNPGFAKKISVDQVNSYFAPNKWAKEIQLDVVEKALLPTRFYYEDFSDQVRLWINEDSTPQPEVRKNFEQELKEALREHGIDIRDRALTIKAAREQLFKLEQNKRRQKAFEERLQQLLTDDKLRDQYFNEAREHITQIEKSQTQDFYKMVNAKVQQIFEQAYLEKLQQIYDKSVQAQSLEKRRMFIKFKKFLFQSRILTTVSQECDRLTKILMNMPQKEPHLKEQWDGTLTIRDMEHPDIKRSFLWHLSSAIGKQSLVPPELAKQYLTDSKVAKQLTTYTFDKAELERLRADVLSNPEKYEAALREKTPQKPLYGYKPARKLKTKEEYDYWYRVLNQGILPQDSLPYYKQLVAYKDFMEQIESKALDTLKLTVQRLIMDFENHESGVANNQVKHFNKKDRETKNQALRRLMSVINEAEGVEANQFSSSQIVSSKSTQQVHLTQSARSSKDIKRFINRLLEQDKDIAKAIPTPELAEKNPMIFRFREEVLNELYQLIEFVLVNNSARSKRQGSTLPPKHLLQERLASLTNPANTQQKNVTNLRILDAYLNEQNSEALIKDAINISKPFFFYNVIRQRLDEEARKVFDAVKAETTGNDVLSYYLFSTWYPEIRRMNTFHRMLNFNEDRDKLGYFESLFPDQSRNFYLKNYIALMGQDAQATTVEELEQVAKKEYSQLAKINEEFSKIDREFDEKVVARDRELQKQPFDPDTEVDKRPELNFYNYDHQELEEIFQYSDKAEQLDLYLEDNYQNILRDFQNGDWLHVYSSAIKDWSLDMDNVMRCTITEDYKLPQDYKSELASIFGGVSPTQMSWDLVADYAQFLSQLYDSADSAVEAPNARSHYDTMSDQIVKQMEIVDGEDLLRSQSVYEKIKHGQYHIGQVGDKQKAIKNELKEFAQLERRLMKQRIARENVEALSHQAPKDVQDIVHRVLTSQSQYLNLEELEKILTAKDYNKLRSPQGLSQIIEKDRIFQDLRKGGNKALQNFFNNYLDTRLDIVSLAEAKETVSHAPISSVFDERAQAQFRTVLDFVEDQLKFVPHSRRESMTLGDFINRHSYLNGGSSTSGPHQQPFMASVLKNKITEVLGEQIDINAAEVIDWEFAGVRTNPHIHQQEDNRTKAALEEGKGYDAEATSDVINEALLDDEVDEVLSENATVTFLDAEGQEQEVEKYTLDYENLLKKAHKLSEMRPEFHWTRNYYENQILTAYSSPNFDQAKIEELVQKYTELRLQDCLLNPEFAKEVKGTNNGHIFLKVLREQIADELKISEPSQASDYAFMKIFNGKPTFEVDVEGRYNTSEISNLQSVGLEKLLNPDAQASTLDKLLGDYFLQKRGQYVESNKLLDQLNKQFGDAARKLKDGHRDKTNDKKQINNDLFPVNGEPNLQFAHSIQGLEKDADRDIQPHDFTAMMELDIATSQALQNGKNGLSAQLREQNEDEQELKIPEYFNSFDARKSPLKYVDDKLTSLLNDVFQARRRVEKTLTRNELLAYDRVLAAHLTKDVLLPRLKTACDQDANMLLQLKQSADMLAEGVKNEELQIMKYKNEQPEFNKSIQNEDALYKFLAYSGMLEKKRRENLDKTRKDNELVFGIENFEEFYKGQLQRDAKREPRQINPADYQPKRVDNAKAAEGFKTTAERESEYFREFEVFKEGKKEQHERNQLFFVLEQFFSHVKQNPDPLNKAQEAIVDYFKDTENTFFFDKNKIL